MPRSRRQLAASSETTPAYAVPIISLVALLVLPAIAFAQSSASFVMRGAALNGGGGRVVSARFALNGCLMPDPISGGQQTSASFVLTSGCVLPAESDACGNGSLDAGETCDDGNTTAGDCCEADCSTAAFSGTPCGSSADNECTDPDTCDGSGVCLDNHAADGSAAASLCGDSQPCTLDQCNGSGGCQNLPAPAGTGCGSSVDDDCTNPDTCDSNGFCLPNHAPAGTSAPTTCNDSDSCSLDQCDGAGDCLHPDAPSGTPCGDSADTDCTDPDTCNSSGVCVANHAPAGSACGDPADSDCTNPDTCTSGGTCQPNNAELGMPCEDFSACTLGDTCGATGSCDSGGQLDCDDMNVCTQDSCDPDIGCVNAAEPRATIEEGGTCRVANSTAVSLRIANDGSGTFKWKWLQGRQSLLESYGAPNADTLYTLCIYDSDSDVSFMPAPRIGEPNDGKQVSPGPRWELDGPEKGWKYKNTDCDEDGIAGLRLGPGEDDEARITLKAKGSCNAVPIPCVDAASSIPCTGQEQYFHMDPEVVVQLVSDFTAIDPLGECWHTSFGDENTVLKNQPGKFKSKRHVRVPLP